MSCISADVEFEKQFVQNPFGYECSICDRLWFKQDLKSIIHLNLTAEFRRTLEEEFDKEIIDTFSICCTCKQSVMKSKIPRYSRTNGFTYPSYPDHLPSLDPIAERLVSIRFPFRQIRRLRTGSKGIIGQVINIPVDIPTEVTKLPRNLEDDYAFNVNIKRHQIHKSIYLKGYVTKSVIKRWLEYLVQKPLYIMHDIQIDNTFFNDTSPAPQLPLEDNDVNHSVEIIPPIAENEENINELLLAKQSTMLFTEENEVHWAPSMGKTPLSLLYDEYAEELSFPSIYLGEPREFKLERVTPYMMATSEIRRRDRRGATPEHILFMAMRVMRFRMRDSIYATFRINANTERLTRKDIEDFQFVEKCMEKNFSFLKSIPNSLLVVKEKRRFCNDKAIGKTSYFLHIQCF